MPKNKNKSTSNHIGMSDSAIMVDPDYRSEKGRLRLLNQSCLRHIYLSVFYENLVILMGITMFFIDLFLKKCMEVIADFHVLRKSHNSAILHIGIIA